MMSMKKNNFAQNIIVAIGVALLLAILFASIILCSEIEISYAYESSDDYLEESKDFTDSDMVIDFSFTIF